MVFAKGLIRLALIDSQKCYKPSQAKSYIVDTSPKYTEYLFQYDGCSSFLIRCCRGNSWGSVNANQMSPFSRTTRSLETNDDSFESPDVWLLGARRMESVATLQGCHAHLSEKSFSFIQVRVAAMYVMQPRPPSFWLKWATYQGFQMRYHTFL